MAIVTAVKYSRHRSKQFRFSFSLFRFCFPFCFLLQNHFQCFFFSFLFRSLFLPSAKVNRLLYDVERKLNEKRRKSAATECRKDNTSQGKEPARAKCILKCIIKKIAHAVVQRTTGWRRVRQKRFLLLLLLMLDCVAVAFLSLLPFHS